MKVSELSNGEPYDDLNLLSYTSLNNLSINNLNYTHSEI